jgi:hypothetical protein
LPIIGDALARATSAGLQGGDVRLLSHPWRTLIEYDDFAIAGRCAWIEPFDYKPHPASTMWVRP